MAVTDMPKNPSTPRWNSSRSYRLESLRGTSRSIDRDQQPAVVQHAAARYRLIKLVAAIPTSTVYAMDTIVAEMTILSIFGSLTGGGCGKYSRAP
jgi:hypothetical protein